MDEYYTTEQVSDKLHINPITVRRWIKSKQIAAIKLGREYRISKNDLQQFLDKRRIEVEER